MRPNIPGWLTRPGRAKASKTAAGGLAAGLAVALATAMPALAAGAPGSVVLAQMTQGPEATPGPATMPGQGTTEPAPMPGAPPGTGEPATPQEQGADQVVGLFAATCLKYPGNAPAVRGFLTTQGAPAMPAQARQAFLGGRAGQVFDTSYQGTRLALISLDDGSCEAVSEFAGADQVTDYLQEAMRDLQIQAQPAGDYPDPKRPAVHQHVWQATLGGRPWLITAVTAPQAPQASLGLHPTPPSRQQ
ncbi:MAG: NMCC_0638 family (lipo)protein [Janthinobacterium lividum]